MSKWKLLVLAGVVAAAQIAMSMLFAPLSYGPVQFRVGDILCVTALFGWPFVIAQTVACVIINMLGPLGLVDVVFGSIATFVSLAAIYLISRRTPKIWLKFTTYAVIYPVVNSLILAAYISAIFEMPYWFTVGTIAIGIVGTSLTGVVLLPVLSKMEQLKAK